MEDVIFALFIFSSRSLANKSKKRTHMSQTFPVKVEGCVPLGSPGGQVVVGGTQYTPRMCGLCGRWVLGIVGGQKNGWEAAVAPDPSRCPFADFGKRPEAKQTIRLLGPFRCRSPNCQTENPDADHLENDPVSSSRLEARFWRRKY